MTNRKSFLAALGLSGASLALGGRADAEPAASPSSAPSEAAGVLPAATASPASKPPSALALAAATAMRRFDGKLSNAEIQTIARGIDDNANAGARLNPKKKRLRNGDEPVTSFVDCADSWE